MYNINNSSKRENNRAFAGLFLVALGVIYLFRQLDFFLFPGWLFSWPVILIAVGIASGIKHNFRNSGSYTLIFVGCLFLVAKVVAVSIFFFWPLIMIAIGVSMLFGRNGYWSSERWEHKQRAHGMYDHNRVDL